MYHYGKKKCHSFIKYVKLKPEPGKKEPTPEPTPEPIAEPVVEEVVEENEGLFGGRLHDDKWKDVYQGRPTGDIQT